MTDIESSNMVAKNPWGKGTPYGDAWEMGRSAALETSHHAELVEALRNLAAVSTNPYDNGPYEDGEVPEIDAAREVLAKVGGES